MKLIIKFCILIIISILILTTLPTTKTDTILTNQLNDIKEMGDTCPFIAIKRLDSISPIIDKQTVYIQNKYALLKIRLHDKAYITHTTDSIIKEVCRYFERNGSNKERQEAYYYMGSVYRDLNDSPNAITYFLKAVAIGQDKTEIDTTLLVNSYSQLSGLYTKQFNDSLALETAIMELNLAKKIKIEDSRSYMGVGNCYFLLKDTFNTIRFYRLALEDIIRKNKEKENLDILSKQLGTYTKLNYKAEADYCHALLKRHLKNKVPNNYLINLAIYYDKYISHDSAKVVLHKLYETSNNIESIYDATRRLTRIYANKNDYKNATFYALEFIAANEAVIKQRNIEHTTNAKNFFQYKKEKEKEIFIKQKLYNNKLYLIIGTFVSILIILIIFLSFYYHKKKLLDIILSKENEIKNVNQLIKKCITDLEELNKEITKKEKELHDKEKHILSLTTRLEESEENVKVLLVQNNELTKFALMKKILSNAEEIIEKFKESANGQHKLSEEDWKDLFGAVNKLYPEFSFEIQKHLKKVISVR